MQNEEIIITIEEVQPQNIDIELDATYGDDPTLITSLDELNGEVIGVSSSAKIAAALDSKAAIREAVNAKGGSITEETPFSQYADAVAHIPGSVMGKPSDGPCVRFFDYDGTLLKTEYVPVGGSATPPELPQHERLVFQEWNNDVSNITRDKDTGAIYTTRSGATEIDIILGPSSGLTVALTIVIVSGDVTIDWGDGTHEVTTSTKPSHTYPGYGEYTLSIAGNWYPANHKFGPFMSPKVQRRVFVADGITTARGHEFPEGTEILTLPASVTTMDIYNSASHQAFKAIIIPRMVTGLTSVNANNTYVVIPRDYSMSSFAGLRGFSGPSMYVPEGAVGIAAGAFRESGLRSAYIPPGVTTVGEKAFMYCYQLISVFFDCPDLESIGADCFLQDTNLKLLRLSAKTPPAITTTTFGGTTLCSIIVPKGCAEAYKNATNWSMFADIIKEMEE